MIGDKKIIFSGVQPSGSLTIGNYIGAFRHWTTQREGYENIYSVVDMHTLTVRQKPAELRQRCKSSLAILIACGVDPEKNTIFMQSHVPAHAELSWILQCYTYLGELNRMTQFKDKSKKNEDNLNAGLFCYPVLMAADILLYQTDAVPVGEDQRQHLELTRDVAERFNNVYANVFTIPEPLIAKDGGKIFSLQEPELKMSKSDPNENSFITLLDPPDVIRRKIKRAVTDSEGEIRYAPAEKPGVSNLLSIYAACENISAKEAEVIFDGKSYADLKSEVGEVVVNLLEPIQSDYDRIISDKAYINEVMAKGRERAGAIASRTMSKVRQKIGLAKWEY